MKNYAQDIFLLTTTLSQLSNRDRIIQIFVESMNDIFANYSFSWCTEKSVNDEIVVDVCTRHRSYGFISFISDNTIDTTTYNLIRNASQVLAIFLEKSEQEYLLMDQKNHLQVLVDERTSELYAVNNQLEKELAERKRVEKELRASEEQYRTLIHKIQAAVVVHGKDTEILSCNSKAQEILGLKEDQLLGKTAISPDWYFIRDDGTRMPLEEYPVNLVIKTGEVLKDYVIGVHRSNVDDVYALVHADPVLNNKNEISQVIVTFIDITELRKSSTLLREKQKLLLEAQQIAHIGNWWHNLKTNEIYWSAESYRIFGIESKKITIEMIFKLIHPEDRFIFKDSLDNTSIDKLKDEHEFRIIRPDRKIRWIHNRWTKIVDDKGKTLQFIGTHQDITERVLVREALYKSEERYRTIFQNSPLGIFRAKLDGKLVEVNNAFAKMFGYDSSELALREIDIKGEKKFSHPADRKNTLKKQKSSIEALQHEIRLINKDGKEFIANLYQKTIFNDKNQPVFFDGIIEDISERKQAEEVIEWNLSLNQALSSLYIPLVSSSMSIKEIAQIVLEKSRQLTKSPHGYVSEIEPESGDMIAHTHTKMIEKECKVALEELRKVRFPKKADGKYDALWGHALNTKESFYTEVPGSHPSSIGIPKGHLEIKRFLAVPVLLAKELVGQIALSNSTRQYTDRDLEAVSRIAEFYALAIQYKRAEGEINKLNQKLEQRVVERTEQLEKANKELEAFAYSVSHDLRAPLRSIDGFSQILLEEYQNKIDDTANDYLNRVRNAAQRMGQLIDDMLSLSHVSRHDMNIQKVNLSKIAMNISENLKSEDTDRHVNFVIDEGIIVDGDSRLLQIAMNNLLGNAWKYTSKDLNARIEFGMNVKNSKPIYFIKDNGVGFDMKYAQKLFKAFQRLHSSSEYPGIGIGLAIVHRIIDRHGGSIWADSEINKGACFYFTIR